MNQFFLHRYQLKPKFINKGSMLLGTKTITEAREQTDADPGSSLNIFSDSNTYSSGTMTKTSAREEQDSDICARNNSFAKSISMGTMTMTKTRENSDTD